MKRRGKEHREIEVQKLRNRAESEEFFDDSPEQLPQHKIQEYNEIGQICEKEREHLMSRKQEMKKNSKKEERYRMEEKSSSQFLPNNGESFQNEESGSVHSSKLEGDAQMNFSTIFKKYEKELTDPRERKQTISEISEITKQSVELIKKKVQRFLKKHKAQKSAQAIDHQTIYRKTEMFDDAIKRVLKVTPYACINDLKEEIKHKLGLDLAKETLIRRLKNLNYSYAKFSLQKKEKNDNPLINKMRRQYYYFYHSLMDRRYPVYFYGYCHIALDECKGSMWMKTKESQELDHTIHERDVINVSIILEENKIEFYRIFEGFYCRENYQKTLLDWAEVRYKVMTQPRKHRAHDKKAHNSSFERVYLMSEASQIHNEGSLLEESDLSETLRSRNVELIAFPPYSYSLNPAEELFNQLKFVVKSKAKIFQTNEFISTVHQAIANNIDIEDIRFAYRKANKTLEKRHSMRRKDA